VRAAIASASCYGAIKDQRSILSTFMTAACDGIAAVDGDVDGFALSAAAELADDEPLRSGIVLDRDLNMNTLLAMYTAITNDSVTVDSSEGLYRAWLARAARACGVRLHIVLPLGYDEFRASSNITERAMDETHFFSTSELNVSDARLVAAEAAHMIPYFAENALHVTRFALGQQSGGARVHVLRADELRQGCVSAAYARMLCSILDVGVGSGDGGGRGARARSVSGDASSAARKGGDELCAACAEIAERAQRAVIARRDELQRRLLATPSYASVTSTSPTSPTAAKRRKRRR
jgi:hypothetical protein